MDVEDMRTDIEDVSNDMWWRLGSGGKGAETNLQNRRYLPPFHK